MRKWVLTPSEIDRMASVFEYEDLKAALRQKVNPLGEGNGFPCLQPRSAYSVIPSIRTMNAREVIAR